MKSEEERLCFDLFYYGQLDISKVNSVSMILHSDPSNCPMKARNFFPMNLRQIIELSIYDLLAINPDHALLPDAAYSNTLPLTCCLGNAVTRCERRVYCTCELIRFKIFPFFTRII